MMKLRQLLSIYTKTISLNRSLGAVLVAGQVVLLLMLTSNSRAAAQGNQAADYRVRHRPRC